MGASGSFFSLPLVPLIVHCWFSLSIFFDFSLLLAGLDLRSIGSMTQRITELIAAGEFYEAQQLCSGMASRAQKAKQFGKALELLRTTAHELLRAKEYNSAASLAQQHITLAAAHPEACTPKQLIEAVRGWCDVCGPGTHPAKLTILRSAMREFETHPDVGQLLCALLAQSYADDGQYALAQTWFLKSGEPEAFSKMLLAWAETGYPNERDLYLTRAVLLYLASGNLRDANKLFQLFLDASPDMPDTPLCNFLKFLLLTLERDAYPLFEVLRRKYKPSLERDPSLNTIMDQISLKYYNRGPPPPRMGSPGAPSNLFNMMGPMMQSLFGGGGQGMCLCRCNRRGTCATVDATCCGSMQI